jgi:uncharacterized peroxidase-related enzyme
MPHIAPPEGLPGILGPMASRPEPAKPLNELAEILLRGPSTLSLADRELIATYVSSQNDCFFCQTSHGSVAAYYLGGNEELVLDIKNGSERTDIPEKLKALLAIAGKVQRSGKDVLPSDIKRARQHGASDVEIHDTVLIAAMFCLANRYVDGLALFAPRDVGLYREMGAQLAQHGYSAALEHASAVKRTAA